MKYLILLVVAVAVFAEVTNEGQVIELTSDNFNSIVLDQKQDVLVKFFAPWCGHCKAMAEAYKQLAANLVDNKNVLVAEMDWTQHKTSAVDIKGFPTLVFFKKGGETAEQIRYSGPRTADALAEFINKNTSHQKDEL